MTAVACVFNGEKCYIDKLRRYDKIRMKGMPTDVVEHHAKKHNITTFQL